MKAYTKTRNTKGTGYEYTDYQDCAHSSNLAFCVGRSGCFDVATAQRAATWIVLPKSNLSGDLSKVRENDVEKDRQWLKKTIGRICSLMEPAAKMPTTL